MTTNVRRHVIWSKLASMKLIAIGVLLIVAANVFWYMPAGPTLLSLPFTWIGIAMILYGSSAAIRNHRQPRSTK